MAVAAQAQRRAAGQPARQVAQAVAEVGFGAGAKDDAGPAGGHGGDLRRLGVRGVHELPAGVEQALAGQPFDRARARQGHAVVDLGHLLGHVDVHRPRVTLQGLGQGVQRGRRRGAQRVDGHARVHPWQRPGPDAVAQAQHARHVGGEAALVGSQLRLREAGALVQHRQQCQADAGGLRGLRQRAAHGQLVGVGGAIGLVVQVVELADLRVAAGQQLGVQVRGHGLQLLGRDAQGHPVHAVAPAPEVVVRAVAPLAEAHERALEGVAVGVDQARQHRASDALGLRGRRGAGRDGGPAALGVHLQQHRVGPGAAHPGAGRPQPPAHAAGFHCSIVCTSRVNKGVTVAARDRCHAWGGASSM